MRGLKRQGTSDRRNFVGIRLDIVKTERNIAKHEGAYLEENRAGRYCEEKHALGMIGAYLPGGRVMYRMNAGYQKADNNNTGNVLQAQGRNA